MPRIQVIRSHDPQSGTTVYTESYSSGPARGRSDPYYDKFFGSGASSGFTEVNGHGSTGQQDRNHGKMSEFLSRRQNNVIQSGGELGPPRSVHHLAQRDKAPDDYRARHHEQKYSGSLFEDEEFPATGRSIYPTRIQHGASFQWKRPKEFCKNPQFISDGVSRFDVRQGELGDCWLLAAIASMSCNPEIFKKVVVPDQDFGENYCGMFRFRIWNFGEWKDVVVDDRLPVRNNKLVFMHSTDKSEFWSALLEKAFAKLNGSYEALSGGNQAEAMEDFTGGLCETVDIPTANKADLLKTMFKASSSHALMGCSIETDDGEIEGRRGNGLITGHAYSITDVRRVNLKNGQHVSMIRVRNPWGNETEWTGDWSDKSSCWNLVDPQEKNDMAFANEDDGEFWMSFEDFASHFIKLEICYLGPELMGVAGEAGDSGKRHWEECIEVGAWKARVSAGGCRNFIDSFHTNPQFKIEIVDADQDDDENIGTIIVGVMQKDMRKKRMGEYLTIGYSIYKLKNPDEGTLDQKFFRFNQSADKSSFVNTREVCKRHRLPPGHYVIIPSTFEPNQEAEFIMRMYSEKPNNSGVLDNNCEMQDMLHHVYGKHSTAQVMENEEPLKAAFDQFCGVEGKIHARQLQTILNGTFMKEIKNFGGFSVEACRSMLALVDANMSGYMEFDEFKLLWNQIRLLKSVFKQYDGDGNGSFDCFELRAALAGGGYQLSNRVFEALAMRYTDHEKSCIQFEDFILLSVRLKTAFDSFVAVPKTPEGYGVVQQDHFLLQTLYL